MKKALLYRLFGIGKIPAPLFAQLNAEGMVLFDEGIKGSVTYRDFRAPRRHANWRRTGFAGSIALTRERLVGLSFSNFVINVPLVDERIRAVHFSVEENGALCMAFDAGLFHADWSGSIECRFRTPEARRLIDLLHKQPF
jgi:hypothetical protein